MINRSASQVNMKGFSMTLSVLGLLWLLAVSPVFAQQSQSAAAPYSLSIAADKQVIRSGTELKVTITVKNTTDHDIRFLYFAAKDFAEMDFRVEVHGENNSPVPETVHGEDVRTGSCCVGSDADIFVPPGKTFNRVLIVNKVFDLTRPGTYKIQVYKKDPAGRFVVRSNTITVKVVP